MWFVIAGVIGAAGAYAANSGWSYVLLWVALMVGGIEALEALGMSQESATNVVLLSIIVPALMLFCWLFGAFMLMGWEIVTRQPPNNSKKSPQRVLATMLLGAVGYVGTYAAVYAAVV